MFCILKRGRHRRITDPEIDDAGRRLSVKKRCFGKMPLLLNPLMLGKSKQGDVEMKARLLKSRRVLQYYIWRELGEKKIVVEGSWDTFVV